MGNDAIPTHIWLVKTVSRPDGRVQGTTEVKYRKIKHKIYAGRCILIYGPSKQFRVTVNVVLWCIQTRRSYHVFRRTPANGFSWITNLTNRSPKCFIVGSGMKRLNSFFVSYFSPRQIFFFFNKNRFWNETIKLVFRFVFFPAMNTILTKISIGQRHAYGGGEMGIPP